MTTSDIAARILCALTSAALVTFIATLIIREHLRERGVAQALLVADMRARDIAADMLARHADMCADDERLRVAERFVLDLSFAATAEQIRRLPEIEENDR